jgi:integrase
MVQTRNRRAGVEDRWTRADGEPSARHGQGLRWLARYVADDGRERTKSFARKVDAQRWVDEQTAALVTGTYIDPERSAVTLASFYAQWAPRQVWVHHTVRKNQLVMESFPHATVALGELRPSHVETWVKAMVDQGLAPLTIQQRVGSLRAILKAAIRDGYLVRDPSLNVKVPRARRTEAAMEIPTPAEVGALVDHSDSGFDAYVALCAFAGLRRGEACAMEVGDIDFLGRSIKVRRQLVLNTRDDVEIRPPKYGSERTVPAPDGLLELLAEHIRRHSPGDEPARPMFAGVSAGRISPNQVWRRFNTARTGARVDTHLHALRHYYASGLIRAGCDVVTVQRAMGHSAPSITLNTYSHLWPDAEDRTRGAAAEMFAQATADWLRTEGASQPI